MSTIVSVKCPVCGRLCDITKRGTIERHRRSTRYSFRGLPCDGSMADAVPLLGVAGGPLETLRACVAGHDARVAAIRERADKEIAAAAQVRLDAARELAALDKLVAKRAKAGAA